MNTTTTAIPRAKMNYKDLMICALVFTIGGFFYGMHFESGLANHSGFMQPANAQVTTTSTTDAIPKAPGH